MGQIARPPPQSEDVVGVIEGLNGVAATGTIGHNGYLCNVKTNAAGSFKFKKYFMKSTS